MDMQSSHVLYVVVVFIIYMLIVWMIPSGRNLDGVQEASSALVRSPQEHMDDGLPLIFKELTFLNRMYEELTLHHRWSCAFFKSFDDASASPRLFAVFTNTCFVFFLNSLLYNVWVDSEPQTDAVQICFLAACIVVVGAPVFVLIDAAVRELSKSRTLPQRLLNNSKALLSVEYTGIVGSMTEQDGYHFLG